MSARFPGRKLSIVRLGVLTGAVVALTAGGVTAWGNFKDVTAAQAIPSIFSGYVDVTATPRYAFEAPVSKEAEKVLLSFIVADPGDACTPSWGAAYSLDEAGSALDLDRRVARLQQLGGSVAVSFGGQINNELAAGCTDVAKLEDAYRSVVDRYNVSRIDLDIEGGALSDTASLDRRASAIAALQKDRRSSGKDLDVWLTLPADPNGLTAAGSDAVRRTIAGGGDLAGVNIMTMDYGGSRLTDRSMFDNAVSAAEATHRQLAGLYRDAGMELGSETVWRKIGLTPMIGQNDVAGEIFTLKDAEELSAYASTKGVGRLSMWSLNRDRTCSPNYPDVKQVSDGCSGVDQGSASYATILGSGVTGTASPSAVPATSAQSTRAPAATDNPSTSPYPIWNETAAYSTGERIVWHANVYEAKWWTRAETPDDPVLRGAATPWRIIGPVLPGDRPTPQLTAPAGTAPQWEPAKIYRKGDRVFFEGRVFEAKWWTQMNSPEAALQGGPESPWTKLSDEELLKLIAAATPSPTASVSP
ncbi:glycosyl hydrolase family 18 protein [Arthrobacter sp. AL08]|uniref:chitinase n=1 Tax=unclassified Arthrobacter TaxID=235627 RepID=UPI00249ACA1B|nr:MULTISPECIES: carbohydrate-binding protein [unclassified Arthrobacter]MDI3242123.1 glycosyl hydrolase family 18 protein [Arthrobacter sp. AL05]MDI3278272.1 glycosyl hydrolase family 18 protein [Arthrobacter sp. AL08]